MADDSVELIQGLVSLLVIIIAFAVALYLYIRYRRRTAEQRNKRRDKPSYPKAKGGSKRNYIIRTRNLHPYSYGWHNVPGWGYSAMDNYPYSEYWPYSNPWQGFYSYRHHRQYKKSHDKLKLMVRGDVNRASRKNIVNGNQNNENVNRYPNIYDVSKDQYTEV